MQAVTTAAADAVLPTIAAVSDRVIRIMGLNPSPMTLQGTNTYLIGTGAERVLIDSGEGVAAYGDLLRRAVHEESARLGTPVRVSTLLLTHWHEDHIGGVDTVRQLFPHVQLYKRPSLYTPTRYDALCAPPPHEIAVEGATLRLLHTPGHTDDHVCAFLAEEKAVFCGDTILGVGSSVFSSFADYMQSLEALRQLQPTRLYSAHGPVVEDGVARVSEMIQHRLMRERQVLQVLRDRTLANGTSATESATSSSPAADPAEVKKGLNIRAIVAEIYQTIPASLHDAAGTNVFHHIKKLMHDGAVVVREAPDDVQAYLKSAADYTTFGEGASMDVAMIHRILSEFYVAAV